MMMMMIIIIIITITNAFKANRKKNQNRAQKADDQSTFSPQRPTVNSKFEENMPLTTITLADVNAER